MLDLLVWIALALFVGVPILGAVLYLIGLVVVVPVVAVWALVKEARGVRPKDPS